MAKKPKKSSKKTTKKKTTKKATKKTAAKKTTSKKSSSKKSSSKKSSTGKSSSKKSSKKTSEKKTAEKTAKKSSAKKKTSSKKRSKKTSEKKHSKETSSKKSAKKTSSKKSSKKTAEKKSSKKTSPKKSSSGSKKKKSSSTSTSSKKTDAKTTAIGTEDDGEEKKPAIRVSLPPSNFKRKIAPTVRIENGESSEKKPCAAEQTAHHKLSAKELKKVRERLEEMRESILSDIKREIDDGAERSAKTSSDESDLASDFYESSVSYEMALAGRQELDEIDAALKKMDQGTYGHCQMCDGYIPKRRLMALPFATYCVRCKEERERGGGLDDEDLWGYLSSDADGGSNDD